MLVIEKRLLMKKNIIILTVIVTVMALFFSACYSNNEINNVPEISEPNIQFTNSEINDAKKVVISYFNSTFEGFNLLALYYDNELSPYEEESYLRVGGGKGKGIERKNVMVLISEIMPTEESLLPYERTNWNWYLVRNPDTGKWEMADYGV